MRQQRESGMRLSIEHMRRDIRVGAAVLLALCVVSVGLSVAGALGMALSMRGLALACGIGVGRLLAGVLMERRGLKESANSAVHWSIGALVVEIAAALGMILLGHIVLVIAVLGLLGLSVRVTVKTGTFRQGAE